jgi:hypothetical protein
MKKVNQMTAINTIDKKNKTSEAALAETLAAGTQKHLSTIAQLVVGGGTYTPSQVEAQLNALATLRNDVDAAKATVKAKLSLEAAQAPALRTFLVAFVGYVRSAFGSSPDVLADFGLAPKKVPMPLTVEQKTARVAKAKATRAARGTKGPKAKLAVKGNVTGIVVTPVTSASTSGAAPQPAQPVLSASIASPSPVASAIAPKS